MRMEVCTAVEVGCADDAVVVDVVTGGGLELAGGGADD